MKILILILLTFMVNDEVKFDTNVKNKMHLKEEIYFNVVNNTNYEMIYTISLHVKYFDDDIPSEEISCIRSPEYKTALPLEEITMSSKDSIKITFFIKERSQSWPDSAFYHDVEYFQFKLNYSILDGDSTKNFKASSTFMVYN